MAYISSDYRSPLRSSSQLFSDRERNLDFRNDRSYSRSFDNDHSANNSANYKDEYKNVRYYDAGMVSDSTKRQRSMASTDDTKLVVGNRYSPFVTNGTLLKDTSGYIDSTNFSNRSHTKASSRDIGRSDSLSPKRYEFNSQQSRDLNYAANLPKSRSESVYYNDYKPVVTGTSPRSPSKDNGSFSRQKENIEPQYYNGSSNYKSTKSQNYDFLNKYNDDKYGPEDYKYSHSNGFDYNDRKVNEKTRDSRLRSNENLNDRAKSKDYTYNSSYGSRQSLSGMDGRSKYGIDSARKEDELDFLRSKYGDIAEKDKRSNSLTSPKYKYLDDHNKKREKSLAERLQRLQEEQDKLERNNVNLSKYRKEDPDKYKYHKTLYRSDDGFDDEDDEVYRSDSRRSRTLTKNHPTSSAQRGEYVRRRSSSEAEERHKSQDRDSRNGNRSSSVLGIRRGTRSLEDSIEKKSVTWGQNSFHELLGEYSSEDGMREKERRARTRSDLKQIETGGKILDMMTLAEERNKRLKTNKERNRESSRIVKADLTGTLSDTVYDAVRLLGVAVAKSPSADCSLIWNDSFVSIERIALLKPHQKINHFAGMDEICKPDNLVKNLNKLFALHPNEYNFLPKSWTLPDDDEKFQAALNQAKTKKEKQYFIVKPVIKKSDVRLSLCSSHDNITKITSGGSKVIVQEYIENPFLLNGCKSHIRLFAIVTSLKPLRVFLYADGFVHLAAEKYEPLSDENKEDLDIHLTSTDSGSKLSLKKLLEFLDDGGTGRKSRRINTDKLWSDLSDLVVLTLLAGHPSLLKMYNLCRITDVTESNESVCFEILAFDIMLDSDLNPWLLQVTRSPDFTVSDSLDSDIKPGIIEDSLLLLNLKSAKKTTDESTEAALKALQKLEEKNEKCTNVEEDTKTLVKSVISLCQEDFSSRKFSEGCGRFRLVFPPNSKSKLSVYCDLLDSAHTHLCPEVAPSETNSDLQKFILQKKREDINAEIKNRSPMKRTDLKPFEKMEIGEDLTLKTLKALRETRINLPGRTDTSTQNLLTRTMENWAEYKPKVADYWFLQLGSSKQNKVIEIVREKIRDIALRIWCIVDVERVKLYRFFLRVFNRLLINHGQPLWDCFNLNRKSSSWEMIFSKSTEVITAAELSCCRRVVQLCCECLLVLYHCSTDVRMSHTMTSSALQSAQLA